MPTGCRRSPRFSAGRGLLPGDFTEPYHHIRALDEGPRRSGAAFNREREQHHQSPSESQSTDTNGHYQWDVTETPRVLIRCDALPLLSLTSGSKAPGFSRLLQFRS